MACMSDHQEGGGSNSKSVLGRKGPAATILRPLLVTMISPIGYIELSGGFVCFKHTAPEFNNASDEDLGLQASTIKLKRPFPGSLILRFGKLSTCL